MSHLIKEYLDLEIPIIETPPSSSDEESDDNSEDLRRHRQMIFQRNVSNKLYDLTELEIRTRILAQNLFNKNIREEAV